MKITNERRLYHLRRIESLHKEIGFHIRCLCPEYTEVDGKQVAVPSREELEKVWQPGRFSIDRGGNLVDRSVGND